MDAQAELVCRGVIRVTRCGKKDEMLCAAGWSNNDL